MTKNRWKQKISKKGFDFKKREAGFTLVELLLSLAIIAILTSASLTIARFSETQKNLVLSANQLKSLIRLAQSYALATPFSGADHICGFGVYFSDDTTANLFYTKAANLDFESNAKNACNSHLKASSGVNVLEKITLSSGVTSSTKYFNNDIFFRSPYGLVYSNGEKLNSEKSFSLISGRVTKDVKINSVGKIE